MFLGNYDKQTYESMIPRIEMLEDSLGKLLPPVYPFGIDDEKAMKGKLVFKDNCQNCHGEHERDAQGFPIYSAPKFFSIEEFHTDSYRTDQIDEYRAELSQNFAKSWLGEYIADGKSERGYFSPKLWGVWSRFPYLHNGSVPTIYDLLREPSSRPTSFSLKRAGEKERFDQNKMGLTRVLNLHTSKNKMGNRDVFKTKKTKGLKNIGHDFGTDLSEADKQKLIEYLKTL